MYMMTRKGPPNHLFRLCMSEIDNLVCHLFPLFVQSTSATADAISRKQHVAKRWTKFANANPLHPTVRYVLDNNVEFITTGYGIFSLLLPENCVYDHTTARDDPLSRVHVHEGLLVYGIIDNSMIGSSGNGLLAHIAQYHGPKEAVEFIDRMQIAAALLSFRHSLTFSLWDCATIPPCIVQRIRDDLGDELSHAASMRLNSDLSYIRRPEQARKKSLAALMRAKEWSEGTVTKRECEARAFPFPSIAGFFPWRADE